MAMISSLAGKTLTSLRNGAYIDLWRASANPEAAQAQLSDVQWRDFEQRYRPIEQAAVDEFLKSPEEAAQRAGLTAAQSFDGGAAMAQRQLRRYGGVQSADQAQVNSRLRGLQRARAIGNAENQTRRQIRDRNLDGLARMIGIGKGVAGSSQGALDQAASMQYSRDQAKDAADEQRKNQMITAGLMAAAMFL